MSVLHISYVKSGGYFLWKIIEEITRAAGINKSFICQQPIYQEKGKWPDFSIDQFEIDQVLIQEENAYYQIETQFVEPIHDMAGYVAATSHVWTHSYLCQRSYQVFPLFDRVFYLVRDPRDCLVSMAHFMFTPFIQRYHAHSYGSPREWLANEMDTFLGNWVRHAEEYWRERRRLGLHILHYERVSADRPAAVREICAAMGLNLAEAQVQAVAQAVSLEKMKKETPQHVRRGARGGYRELLTQEEQKKAWDIIGPLWKEIRFSQGNSGGTSQPTVSDDTGKRPISAQPKPRGLVQEGLYVHVDASAPSSYPKRGMIWRDLRGNHDVELPGESSDPRSDPFFTGESFVFSGSNHLRLLNSQRGWFKSLTKEGAQFTIDCCFRTGPAINNPHFLLADAAHGNPVEGCGFAFYFFNFQNSRLRISIQNNAQTPLTRSMHATHPQDLEPNRFYHAAVAVNAPQGKGLLLLNDQVHEFDATYVKPTTRDSPYYVNIGAPGNIEYNAGAQIGHHVSQLSYPINDHEQRMQIPYGRMRFNPGFQLYRLLVYQRPLRLEELAHNGRHHWTCFNHSGTTPTDLPPNNGQGPLAR